MSVESVLLLIACAALPGAVAAWGAGFGVRRLSLKLGFVDRPGDVRKVHTKITPLGGGLTIWLGVSLTLLTAYVVASAAQANDQWRAMLPRLAAEHLAGLQSQFADMWGLWTVGTLLMLVGLCDDYRGLGWRLRLAAQFAAAGFVCWRWPELRITAFIESASWLHIFLSTVWIVALVNSFNMLDNMDGLSAGVAAIAASALAAALLMTPDPSTSQPQLFVAGLLLVVIGAASGFLWHNRPPARLFMGDAGSYFVGYCIAIATLLANWASYQSQQTHAILAPLLVMAVPLYDMATVLWIRIREGRSPFQADRSHFSHRLVELGMSKPGAVLTIYLTTATCGLAAMLLPQLSWLGAIVDLLIVACVLALIYILETAARRKLNQGDSRDV